tara:strand:- start:2380 stop:3042 length:663 start_codon:yes stop_codon:yes gene_type:complete
MEFSSTETYANRYDLDEISVFLEGNSNNPMYFDVSGLPQNLSIGKHYFYLNLLNPSNQEYQLREGSRILFEVKSSNNVVLKSDVTSINQRNGYAICFTEVLQNPLRTFKEVADGQANLVVVGSLENKSTTQNLIPDRFLGAMNYRCTFPISISKNILNADSPFIINTDHNKETTKGQFSFAKASISPLKTSTVGLKYEPETGKPKSTIFVQSTNIGGKTS